MKKIIKKYGSSYIILMDAEDIKIYKLKAGDIVEVELKKYSEEK